MRTFAELLTSLQSAAARKTRFSPKATNGRMRSAGGIRLSLQPLEPRLVLDGGPLVISEFLAVNDTVLEDEDHDHPDWIEIYNSSQQPVVLDGWYLTDNANNLTKWEFPDHVLDPEITLGSGEYLIVFASNKNRRVVGAPLHTNFVLDAGGEYLALVRPDGRTVAQEFAPEYPQQFEDVSYGSTDAAGGFSSADGVEQTYLVPTAADAPLGTSWTMPGFDDSPWTGSGIRASRVLITEAGTGGIDFVEIQNVSGGPVDTSGWVVAVNDGSGTVPDINRWTETLWNLDPSLPAGEVFYQTDNPDDNYWGESILWNRAGSGAAVILDDQGNLADFVVWGYDAAEIASLDVLIGGHRVTAADAWNGGAVPAEGDRENSLQRSGSADHDNASDWAFTPPPSMGAANDELETPFVIDLSNGLGFDASGSELAGAILIDVEAAMHHVNASLWTRISFEAGLPSGLDTMWLRMKYNDGFVAYINGQEVARRNAPETPQWNASATAARTVADSLVYEEIDIIASVGALQEGTNVLAIHTLNLDAADDTLLVLPDLTGGRRQYFRQPTPGDASGLEVDVWGPIISNLTENPPPPSNADELVITAEVKAMFNPVDRVTLHYRVDYGSRRTTTMVDNGSGRDATAGDGIYTAVIPASRSGPGDMVRWYVTATDTAANESRFPAFLDADDSPEYFGTMVLDPSVQSELPVLYWFVQNPSAADGRSGTRGSLFFDGNFYDNILTDLHGQSSAGFPKKSYDFDFNKRDRFKWADGQLPVKDFNLLTNWADKSKTRNTLAYEVWRDADAPHHFAFPVRVQQNGQFFSTADFVEDGDDVYLERIELDPRGALYKMYNRLESVSGGEKKTRKWEGKSDLQALINGTGLSSAARTRHLYDNVNIAEAVNYLASIVISGTIDIGHKNYYVYRDTEGTGEWQILPWDVDLSFGRNWTGSLNYYDDNMYVNNPLYIGGNYNGTGAGGNNRLMDAMYETSSIREMYLRRVRTLMDEQLQPPGRPPSERLFEQRLDELVALMDPNANPRGQGSDDADRDYQRWGSWGNRYSMREDVNRMKTQYFEQRRNYLYGLAAIPDAQIDVGALPPDQRNIDFGTIEFSPASGNQDEEYIAIVNNNAFSVDMSRWRLDGGVRFTFLSGTVIPAGGTLYVSPDVKAFRARATGPRGNQGLFVVGGYSGHLSSFGETVGLLDANGVEIDSATYVGDPSGPQQFLRIAEIMYDPPQPSADEIAAGFDDNDLFEFIELINTGTQTLNLAGVGLTEGVQFTFDTVTLPAGERVLAVRSRSAFEARYGTDFSVAGQFTSGKLSNGGEEVKLEDALSGTILEFVYDNGGEWPREAGGSGASLEIIDPAGDYGDPGNWRFSTRIGGTPGAPPEAVLGVVVNEVLSHTDAPQLDTIELLNVTAETIDVGGWYLSDSASDYSGDGFRKFRIPDGTMIPAGGYLVFDERDFNPTPGIPESGFALNGAEGDDVWLVAPDASGRPVRFSDHVEFAAAANGESFGRWPNGSGDLYPMLTPTLTPPGGPNSGPRVGPVVISEVHYHPNHVAAGDMEFIELYNPTSTTVDLGGWRIRKGIDFDLADNTLLGSHATLVIVPFDPSDAVRLAAFREEYAIDESVELVGGYRNQLNNGGERVQLQRAAVLMEAGQPGGEPATVAYLLEDEVLYDDLAPWPTGPGGLGDSLNRLGSNRWGNVATSWTAEPPSPGSVSLVAEVAGRHVFYNHSALDGNHAGANAQDDAAIATDKQPLRPGQSATFANYTSYVGGLNAVMVDVADLPAGATLAADDFRFRVGNDNQPDGWTPAANPASITVRPDEGTGNSDRITLIWPDKAIQKQWLQVTILATADTGLPEPDVFYFGNAPGESGNSTGDTKVNAFDMLGARDNRRNFLYPAPIDFPFDYNRDQRVDAADMLIARANQTHFLNALRLITVPGGKAAGEQASAAPRRAAQDAVFRQAVEREPGRAAVASSKLDWLHEFDQMSTQKRPSRRDPSAEAAADEVLAMNWM